VRKRKRKGKQEVGRALIFIVGEAHAMILQRQPCLADPKRKLWESILGSRYFGPAREGEEGKGIRFRGI
jgi:hypothetical protein